MKNITLLTLLVGLLVTRAYAQEEDAPHRTLANTCAGCHGTYGYSAEPMPIIAGLPAAYLRKVMQEYKSGKRSSTVMGRLATGYSDSEIDAIAAFFASRVWMSPKQEVDPTLVKRGQQVHAEKCELCHKNNGRYQDDTTPRLAGQWRQYLEILLQDYRRPEWKMPHKYMTLLSRQLLPHEVAALPHFYANQK